MEQPYLGRQGRFGDYDVFLGHTPIIDAVQVADKCAGGLPTAQIGASYETELVPSVREEEAMLLHDDCFNLRRYIEKIREALRAIVAFVFDGRLGIPQDNGLIIGAGEDSLMMDLLPRSIDRSRWFQTEGNLFRLAGNPSCYKANKSPNRVYQASPLNLPRDLKCRNLFPVVIGLDVLGDHNRVEDVVSSVRDVLANGGFFVHIQADMPNPMSALRGLYFLGEKPPHDVRVLRLRRGSDETRPVLYRTSDRREFTRMELYRGGIGRVVKDTPHMARVLNHWVTVMQEESRHPGVYTSGVFFPSSDKKPIDARTPHAQWVSAVVTIAKKVRGAA